MRPSGFVRLEVPPAVCEGTDGKRSSARCVWVASILPDDSLTESALLFADRCPRTPGRVHGLGDLLDPGVHAALLAQLPPGKGLRLRERFEWYACRGAGFHTDAHYGGVLFGAWCVAGPKREIVFSRSGLRVGAAVGELVVFDPFEPHAVLDPGQARYAREHFERAPVSLFLGFEIDLDAAARVAFGIGAPPAGGAILSSAVAVNAETGALPGSR